VEEVIIKMTRLFSSRNTLVVIGVTLLLGVLLAPVAQADPGPQTATPPTIADYQSTANIESAPSIAHYQSTANIESAPSIAHYQSTANIERIYIADNQSTANAEPTPSIPSSGFQYWWVFVFSVMAILVLAGAGTVIMGYRHQAHPVG
jgi:cytoskeletal protein RodZ